MAADEWRDFVKYCPLMDSLKPLPVCSDQAGEAAEGVPLCSDVNPASLTNGQDPTQGVSSFTFAHSASSSEMSYTPAYRDLAKDGTSAVP